jgi:nucleoside-diphosphate-sugar epimerase
VENCLIGYTGFVGGTLLKQTTFEHLYRSTNIQDIAGRSFETVVCAGAPAVKWLANKDPANDARVIDSLIQTLSTVKCKKFILISTVDVFKEPQGVDEASEVVEDSSQAYGYNRRRLEKFVESHFQDYMIVRLPGLVGPGLKKNIIFDLLNSNNVAAINAASEFQFYPMVNLWSDILIAARAGLKIIHLTSEPISTQTLAGSAFNIDLALHDGGAAAHYDMRTRHAELYGITGLYQYSARDTVQAARWYGQSEPKKALLGG